MRYPNPQGNNLDRMQGMQIFLPGGTVKPIMQLAEIKTENGVPKLTEKIFNLSSASLLALTIAISEVQ